jgi:methylase of polypeptide subunit release factors
VVCNPPWLPARASSPIERAVYDEGSRMLKGFLAGLASHLSPGGEGWLILSDLAEHLGLRSRAELMTWIAEAGLTVLGKLDTRARARQGHRKPPMRCTLHGRQKSRRCGGWVWRRAEWFGGGPPHRKKGWHVQRISNSS